MCVLNTMQIVPHLLFAKSQSRIKITNRCCMWNVCLFFLRHCFYREVIVHQRNVDYTYSCTYRTRFVLSLTRFAVLIFWSCPLIFFIKFRACQSSSARFIKQTCMDYFLMFFSTFLCLIKLASNIRMAGTADYHHLDTAGCDRGNPVQVQENHRDHAGSHQ